MKGQFFILGAVLVCSLFFIGLPRFAPIISQPSADLPYISANLRSELPHAMNLGMKESAVTERLENFTHFIEGALSGHNINYTSLWLVFRNQSTDLNVTGGGFLGEDVTVSLNVTDGSGSTVKTLPLPNGTIDDVVFSAVGTNYNVTISFSDQEEGAEWPRDKASLYAFYRLNRGDDVIKNFVVA